MEQTNRTAWATDILALNDKINTTFRSRNVIHQKKCDVFNILVNCTAHYVQLWWMGRFREEINTKSAEAVGKELLKVLERGLRLLQHCGEKDFAKSNLIIFCRAGEFFEIVDDVERYSSMMNKLIALILLNLDIVDKLAEKKLIEQLQNKVKLDCSMLQDALTSAHTQDSSSLDWVKNLDMQSPFKHYFKMLGDGKALHPFSIAYNDLNPGRYLGKGSYGAVSKGFWCETIPVAIKEFFYDDQFESEYKMVKELLTANSSHIVQVFGHSEAESVDHGNRKFIVMELMDMDLRKLIQEKKKKSLNTPFTVNESTDLMLQIAKGLRDLHRVKVVHRDIKPGNILVRKADGSIKLADFGLSKANFETKYDIHTKKQGTTLYMAPEMVADEGNYSKKVDVYSYGLVCMEILTGEPYSAMLEDLLKQGLSTPLYSIISNCLQLEPDKRPSFEEICDDLWAFKESILIIQDEVPSYIDEQVILSNFRMYTKTLGKAGISMTPRISTPTEKRAIFSFWAKFFGKGLRHLPIDSLVDIELGGLSVEPSGQIKFRHPWHSVGNGAPYSYSGKW